ncbi:LysR family transcriptional regulator [Pokkaliibacter plantistimulans]|uniref:LysR family transcriptional regulator n=1 Tax=Proteobacteria bacterium 228 TaxID=2083153 RepID=A0A2S5KLL1_9PROT|nr:LysR family transcriptional regulator [Pokkaliibacter plantistimulans]PPC75688.1 LysR family transcriptional regulator [Pokkaliibacter plantistimulans]
MALTRFTLRQLETFITVAEVQSFTKAGENMGLSASAVSQLILELENVLGFRLFDRTTRRVTLSQVGKQFLSSAQSVLKHADLAEATAADIRNKATGIVRIAAPLVIASAILPALISTFTRHHPGIRIRISDCAVDKLVDAIADGDAELAIGPDRQCGDDVQRQVLFNSPWILWCAPSHPLATSPEVTWSDLRRHDLVAAGRDHERNVALMHAELPADQRISPIDVVDNISTALGIAAAGLAATVSPEYVGALAKPFGLVKKRIQQPEIIRQVCLYKPVRRELAPASEAAANFLIEQLSSAADQTT